MTALQKLYSHHSSYHLRFICGALTALALLGGGLTYGTRAWLAEASALKESSDASSVGSNASATSSPDPKHPAALPAAALSAEPLVILPQGVQSGVALPALDLLDTSRYTSRSSLPPSLRWNMAAFGDRLEVKGKERLNVVGTIRRAGESADVPVRFIYQHPAQLSVELPGAGATGRGSVIGFDRRTDNRRNREPGDQAIIETLVYDTAERFFSAVANGAAMRQIGTRLPMDENASADEVTTRYDVYELIEGTSADDKEGQRKLFYFDSETLLLAYVRYITEEGGAAVSVEVSGWQRTADGQQVPGKIVRAENGEPVLTLNLNAVTLSPGVADPATPAVGAVQGIR